MQSGSVEPKQTGTTAQAAAVAQSETQDAAKQSSVFHAKLSATPPKIVRADGNWLYTAEGVKIFDATGGPAVASLGHNNARVKKAIMKQLDTVDYCYSPFFTTSASEDLAKFLTESTGGQMSKVFITSSGAEAIEAALKLARQYFLEMPTPQPQRTRFIGRHQSYHGNTLGSMSVGSHKARKSIYTPLLSDNFSHVSPCYPYRGKLHEETDAAYVQRLADELDQEFHRVGANTVCAFVAETIPGLTLGGPPSPPGYLRAMKAVCQRHGALLILDEVLCGMGRSGSMHAWQQEDVVPDLQTVAKGLGAGYQPIGALLVNKDVVAVMEKGTGSFIHVQTYQGHAVTCAAALEVQAVVRDEKLLQNVKTLAPYLEAQLQTRLAHHPNVGDIRGKGFMWGIELVTHKPTKTPFPVSDKVAARMHATGLHRDFGICLLPGGGVADGTDGDVVMVTPAYTCTKEELDLVVERTARVVESVLGSGARGGSRL